MSVDHYPWDLLPGFTEDIEHGRLDRVRESVDAMLDAIEVEDDDDASVLKLRCAQCMSACLRGARRGGAPSDVLLREHVAALRRLAALGTRPAMRRLTRRYLVRLATLVQPAARTAIHRSILAILADMAATVERPKPLVRYARDLELSLGHLSRSFSRIVGRSFRAEQRRLRDLAARRLLTTTAMPMAALAHRVGLASASQFVADFRRAHGITPAEFRRREGRTAPVRSGR